MRGKDIVVSRRIGGGRVLKAAVAAVLGAAFLVGGCRMEKEQKANVGKQEGPVPRFDAWTIIGPGGGGTTVAPTVSPHDPKVVFEHCDMTGAYVTTDAAASWRMFNLRSGIGVFAFDPGNPSVVYAGNAALWRSEDTGKTWSMVFPDPAKNTVEHMNGDHSDYFLTSDEPIYPKGEASIRAIAVDPDDSNRIYIAFSGTSLLVSSDRGKTWDRLREQKDKPIPYEPEAVLAIHVEKAPKGKEKRMFVVCESGVYRGAADRWERTDTPGGGKITCASMGTTKGSPDPVLYACIGPKTPDEPAFSRFLISTDRGRTWTSAAEAVLQGLGDAVRGKSPSFGAVACCERSASTAYVSLSVALGETQDDVLNAILRTDDTGKTWRPVFEEKGAPAKNLAPSWIEFRSHGNYPNVYFSVARDLGVAPTDPNICYATDLFRTYRTLDGGKTWRQVNSVAVFPAPTNATRAITAIMPSWTTRGLDVTTCYGVHWDPFDPQHMFITYTDIGLFQSADGGKSWFGSTEGVPNTWRNTTYWIVFDPEVEGLMWGAFALNHDLPRPKMWRRRDTDTFEGGVCVSTDGGRSWKLSNDGMPQTAVTHLLMDPAGPKGGRVLYACAFGRGVFKSVDNGKTWTLKNRGIEKEKPFAWRLTRADDGTLYLIVARRSERGRIGDADDGALYRSSDGAESWVKMTLPDGVNGPNGLTLDPTDNRRMYLSAWGVYRAEGDTGGGVFLSTDAGATWRNVFSDAQHVYDLTVGAKDPETLYICGFDSGAWRSADRGQTWQRIRGYNFKWGHRVVCDPVHPGSIYITTFGGSVWHGPAAGDPDAPEDIVR